MRGSTRGVIGRTDTAARAANTLKLIESKRHARHGKVLRREAGWYGSKRFLSSGCSKASSSDLLTFWGVACCERQACASGSSMDSVSYVLVLGRRLFFFSRALASLW